VVLRGRVEWIFIFIVVAILYFGVKKFPVIARSFQKATAKFEELELEQNTNLNRLLYS
jgi:Sec-independent protein translocase protein TatA